MNLGPITLLATLLLANSIQAQEPKKATPPAAQDKSDLNPMIAAQAKARSKALKAKKAKATPVKRIDLNSASRDELKTLPGITDAIADQLIAGRPYRTKTQAVTKNILPYSVYASIKGRVAALPPK